MSNESNIPKSKTLLYLIVIPVIITVLLFIGIILYSFSFGRSRSVKNFVPEIPQINYSSLTIPGKLISVSNPFVFSIEANRRDFALSLDSYELGSDKIKELKNFLIDKSVKTWANSSNEIDYRKSEEGRLDFDGILPKDKRGDYDFFSMSRFANTQYAGLDKQFYGPINVLRKDKRSYEIELKPTKLDYNYTTQFQKNMGESPVKIRKENVAFSELDCVTTRLNGINIILLSLRGYDKTNSGNNTLDSNSVSCTIPNLDPSKKYYVDYYQRFMTTYNGSDDAIEVNKDYWIDVIEALGK